MKTEKRIVKSTKRKSRSRDFSFCVSGPKKIHPRIGQKVLNHRKIQSFLASWDVFLLFFCIVMLSFPYVSPVPKKMHLYHNIKGRTGVVPVRPVVDVFYSKVSSISYPPPKIITIRLSLKTLTHSTICLTIVSSYTSRFISLWSIVFCMVFNRSA